VWNADGMAVDGMVVCITQAGPGTIYQACRAKAKNGEETDAFETAEEAARAYDDTAFKKDHERAHLNLSGEYDYIGQHVKDELYPLNGEDGISVIGVQAGVASSVRLRLKFFSAMCNYLEIHLDKASCLPKMDTGLGTCDAYCHILVGDYHFHTRVVRNSLDPAFHQTFRIATMDAETLLEIKVQVWDWDKWNEDDHMGDSIIKIDTAGACVFFFAGCLFLSLSLSLFMSLSVCLFVLSFTVWVCGWLCVAG